MNSLLTRRRDSFALAMIAIGLLHVKSAEAQTNDNCANNAGACLTASNSDAEFGVYATSAGAVGVYGQTTSTTNDGSAAGVYGSGGGIGVYGATATNSGYGVYGFAASTMGSPIGVFGLSGGDGVHGESTGGSTSGVSGKNTSTSGSTFGVHGLATASSSGTGVYGAGGAYGVYGQSSGTAAVYASGDLEYTGALTHVSDERLKKDISPLKGSLAQLLRLRGVSYLWKEPEKHGSEAGTQRGFIAQEYEKVFPEWVRTDSDGYKRIATDGLDALEVESIRALEDENEQLRERVTALEHRQSPAISWLGNSGLGFGLAGFLVAGAFMFKGRSKREASKDES